MKKGIMVVLSLIALLLCSTVGNSGIAEASRPKQIDEEQFYRFYRLFSLKYRLPQFISRYLNAPELILLYGKAEEKITGSFPSLPENITEKAVRLLYTAMVFSVIAPLKVHDDLVRFIQMVYEFMALFTGHNPFTMRRCVFRTSFIVIPVIFLRGGSVGSSNFSWILFDFSSLFDDVFFRYGVFALIVLFPYLLYALTINFMYNVQHMLGGFIDFNDPRGDVADTYNEVDWGF